MSKVNTYNNKQFIHPYKVIMYLAMASILMFFAITTSALLVKKGDTMAWEAFKLPTIFFISTLILLSSSALMHYAKHLYGNLKFQFSRLALLLSILLALVFVFSQYLGFKELNAMGKPLAGNASGSFIWVIVISHALHIIGGLFFALLILFKSFRNRNNIEFEGSNMLNPKRLLSLELVTMYWHFIDFIWIYLFIFFYFNY